MSHKKKEEKLSIFRIDGFSEDTGFPEGLLELTYKQTNPY